MTFSMFSLLSISFFSWGSFWGFSVRLTPLINAGSLSLCILQFVALECHRGRGKRGVRCVVFPVVATAGGSWRFMTLQNAIKFN